MTVKTGGLILALAMLAILAAGLWYRHGQARRVVASGIVHVAPAVGGVLPVTLSTRVVMLGPTRFEEVELPNGTWIDCAGDCVKAAREAGPDFWEAVRRNAGGR